MMQGTKDTHRLQQIMRRTLGGWIADSCTASR